MFTPPLPKDCSSQIRLACNSRHCLGSSSRRCVCACNGAVSMWYPGDSRFMSLHLSFYPKFRDAYARHVGQMLDEGRFHSLPYMMLLVALKMIALCMKTKSLARRTNRVNRQRFSLYDSVGGQNAMPANGKTPHRKADVSTLRFRRCPKCRPC